MLFSLALGAAFAGSTTPVGPAHVSLPLYRVDREHPSWMVEVALPDGSRGLFRLALGPEPSSILPEVGGCAPAPASVDAQTRCRWIDLGELRIPDVRFRAAGPTASTEVDGVPLLGVLGSDLWQRLGLTLDLRADRLHLYAEGRRALPRRSTPWMAHGTEGLMPVQIVPLDPQSAPLALVVHLHTDAPPLTLESSRSSEGLDAQVAGVRLGGRIVSGPLPVRWNDDDGRGAEAPARGVVGTALVEGMRVRVDPMGGWFQLQPGRGLSAFHDARAWSLEHPPTDPVQHAALLEAAHQTHAARSLLEAALLTVADATSRARLSLALARLERGAGQPERAGEVLARLEPSDLDEESTVRAIVDGLIAEGRDADALRWRTALRPEATRGPDGWWTESQLTLLEGDVEAAWSALAEGRHRAGDPGWAALDRARVALARGDLDGAAAVLRTAALLRPTDAPLVATYALVAAPRDPELVAEDLRELTARLDTVGQEHLTLARVVSSHRAPGGRSDAVPPSFSHTRSTEGTIDPFTTAMRLWLAGDLAHARTTASEALRRDPSRSDLRTLIALFADASAPAYQSPSP